MHCVAVGRGFEAPQTDLHPAGLAVAVFAALEVFQGLLDFLDQLSFAIARAQLQAEFGFLRSAVIRIREIGGLVLHVMHGAVDFPHQLVLPTVKDAAEVLDLSLAHIFFAVAG